MLRKTFFYIIAIILIIACNKEDESAQITPPVPALYAAANQTTNTCEFYGAILEEGSNAVLVRGFCWRTDTLPALGDSVSENGSGPGSYNTTAYNLSPQTKYHVRAYARTEAGVYYSREETFFTR